MSDTGNGAVLEGGMPSPRDLYETLGTCRLQRDAYKKGMSVSAFLERINPASEFKDNLDATERLLRVAQIRTKSDPARGVWADTMDAFDPLDGDPTEIANKRALCVEWAARVWRRTRFNATPNTRAILTSDENALNTSLRPYFDEAGMRRELIESPVPLSELVAINTPIRGDAVRQVYLVEPAADAKRFFRVPQGSPIPVTTIAQSEHVARLYKYGRGVELTYEAMRRQPIDKVALIIALIAIQVEFDELEQAVGILISGDDNPSTAATVTNLTTLDAAATPPNLTLKAWLKFKLLWPPYMMTHALARTDEILQVRLLNYGSANFPLFQIADQAGFGEVSFMNRRLSDAVAIGNTDAAPAARIVGIDSRFALERLTEVGADIQETEAFVQRQTRAVYLSEVVGFQVIMQKATKILRLDA